MIFHPSLQTCYDNVSVPASNVINDNGPGRRAIEQPTPEQGTESEGSSGDGSDTVWPKPQLIQGFVWLNLPVKPRIHLVQNFWRMLDVLCD